MPNFSVPQASHLLSLTGLSFLFASGAKPLVIFLVYAVERALSMELVPEESRPDAITHELLDPEQVPAPCLSLHPCL